jgi:hypothetical protein
MQAEPFRLHGEEHLIVAETSGISQIASINVRISQGAIEANAEASRYMPFISQ